jgi:hypothetical protein
MVSIEPHFWASLCSRREAESRHVGPLAAVEQNRHQTRIRRTAAQTVSWSSGFRAGASFCYIYLFLNWEITVIWAVEINVSSLVAQNGNIVSVTLAPVCIFRTYLCEIFRKKVAKDRIQGPMLWFFKYFRQKKLSKKLAFLSQNKAKFWKKLIITLVFEKNAIFSPKIGENRIKLWS